MKRSRLASALALLTIGTLLIGCGGGGGSDGGGGGSGGGSGTFDCSSRGCRYEYLNIMSYIHFDDLLKGYSPYSLSAATYADIITSETRWLYLTDDGKNNFLKYLNSRLSYNADGVSSCHIGKSYRYYGDLYELTKNRGGYDVLYGNVCADIDAEELILSARGWDSLDGAYEYVFHDNSGSPEGLVEGVKFKLNARIHFDYNDEAAKRLGHTFANRAAHERNGLLGYSFTCASDRWHCQKTIVSEYGIKYRVDWSAANDVFEWSLEMLTIPSF
jgi:hypothetical protein